MRFTDALGAARDIAGVLGGLEVVDEAAGGVPRYDPHLADGGRRLDDVAEHRQGDLAAELLGKPALTFLPERDHDEHRRRE